MLSALGPWLGWIAQLWLLRLPCMPVELGAIGTAKPDVELAPPLVAPVPLPPAARFPERAPLPLPPPLAMNEVLRYRVEYGVLDIGEVRLSIDSVDNRAEPLVRAAGYGEGAILGLGRLENRVDAEFDAQQLSSRRWTNQRTNDKGPGTIRDLADQPRQGQVQMTRERSGAPTEHQLAVLPGPTFDPVGFLLRVRVAPPPLGSTPQVLQVLDGKALWRVTLANAGRGPLPDAPEPENAGPVVRALRIEGRAEPIRYNGTPDVGGDRVRRDFVLWLSDEPSHVPLRLEMPLGISDLVVALVEAERRPR